MDRDERSTTERPLAIVTDSSHPALGKAAVIHKGRPDLALESLTGPNRPIFDVVELLDEAGRSRLCAYAQGSTER